MRMILCRYLPKSHCPIPTSVRLKSSSAIFFLTHTMCYPTTDVFRKRTPVREPISANELYISSTTVLQAAKVRIRLILDGNLGRAEDANKRRKIQEFEPGRVTMHALGKAIIKAIDLSLSIQAEYGNHVQIGVHTKTVKLVDDYEPLHEVRKFVFSSVLHTVL